MAEETNEFFELDEGGYLDDEVVTVVDAYFAPDAKYASDQLCLQLFLRRDEADGDNEPVRQLFSLGNGWSSENNGASVTRVEGKKKVFHKTSSMGLFLGGLNATGAAKAMLGDGKSPFDANSYLGLQIRLGTVEVDYKGEIGKKQKLIPVEFLGFVDVDGDGQSGTVTAGAKAEPKAKGIVDMPDEVRVKLTELAKAAGTHAEFVEKALDVDGVQGNPALEAAVMKPAAFYASVKAEG
jgi:hypothetical protein